jgi:hypothetical protein
MSGNGSVSFLRAGLKRGRDCMGMKVRVTGGFGPLEGQGVAMRHRRANQVDQRLFR